MTDKHIRTSLQTWEKLRAAAYERQSHIKTVFEDIMSGKIDPITLKDV